MTQLIRMNRSHLAWLMQQRNRPELMKYFRQEHQLNFPEQVRWYHSLDFKKVRLFIVYDESGQIGYAGFNPINWEHKHAEFGVFIIPEKQGNGVGKDVMLQLLNVGFNELNLEKIYSDVLDYPEENKFDFYKKLGFKEEGRLKNHYLKDGKWVDSIVFALERNAYKKGVGRLGVGKEESVRSSQEVQVLG